MNRLTPKEIAAIHYSKPRVDYRKPGRKRNHNIDRNGDKVCSGCKVRMLIADTVEEVVIRYDHRLGWVFWSEKHGQDFIVPTEHNPYTRVNLFHLCEVTQ